MAHNLKIINGKVSFASAKEKAWHGLGQVLDHVMTSGEAIVEAGLDFEVEKLPLFCRGHNYSRIDREITTNFAIGRKDNGKIFGVVGNRYEIIQNRDAFSFFDSIVGEGEAIYETAGALGDGETIFITAKLPSYIKIGKDDIEKYLLLTMSHDGSSPIQALFTPIRVVCNNTLSAALSHNVTNRVVIRHTKSAHERIKEAHKVLGIVNQLSNELSSIFNFMSNRSIINENKFSTFLDNQIDTCEEQNLNDYLKILYPGSKEENEESTRIKNIRSDIKRYYYEGVGQDSETCKGTVFGMYNAVTGYLQNVKSYKTDDSKMRNIFMGNDYMISQKAFDLAKKLI